MWYIFIMVLALTSYRCADPKNLMRKSTQTSNQALDQNPKEDLLSLLSKIDFQLCSICSLEEILFAFASYTEIPVSQDS
jgi:hypothetical protein